MSESQAVEEVTPVVEESTTDPGDVEIIESTVNPPTDPRVAAIAEQTAEVDRQADILRGCQNEAIRLAGRRRPNLNDRHDLTGVDDGDGYNKDLDAKIKEQRENAERAQEEIYRLQSDIAKITAAVQRDRITTADPWRGSQKASLNAVEKAERVVRQEHRRLTSEIDVTKQRIVKAKAEVEKTAWTVDMYEKRLAEETGHPDPLHPDKPRNTKADLKIIRERLDNEKIEQRGIESRLAELETKQMRVKAKLDDFELCRLRIRVRQLWLDYERYAEPMGKALSELRTIYESDQRPSPHQDAINASVNWPFANSALKSIAALPRPFFPPSMPVGNESSFENVNNFFYSSNSLCVVKEVQQ